MAATDWRDIVRRGGAASPAPAPQPMLDAAPAPPSSPEIDRLLAQRAALEARMAALTGGDANDPRYPVTPLAQRRAEYRRWEDDRSSRAAALAADRRAAAPVAAAPRNTPPARIAPASEPRSGATPVDPRRWYAQRDTPAPQPRAISKPIAPPKLAVPKAAPAEKPRRPAAITPVKPVTRVKPPTPTASRQPDPLAARDAQRAAAPKPRAAAPKPRAAAEPKRPEPQRPEPKPREPAKPLGSDLRRALGTAIERPMTRKIAEKIGAERIAKPKEKIQKPLERARESLDSANRAGRTLSDAWDKRRDRIAGPDMERYTQGYDARKARLFGVDTGSLNDLAKRTESQRQAGIARRAEARRAETADENRRSRATEKRKANRDQS